MMKFLTFHFKGEQQWIVSQTTDYLETNRFPTFSGIHGFLAAALGIDREDFQAQENLCRSIETATKSIVPTEKFEDFNMVRCAKSAEGEVVPVMKKTEVLRGHFIVAVFLKENACYTLETIRAALIYGSDVIFPLYMGAKKRLLRADFHETVMIEEAESV